MGKLPLKSKRRLSQASQQWPCCVCSHRPPIKSRDCAARQKFLDKMSRDGRAGLKSVGGITMRSAYDFANVDDLRKALRNDTSDWMLSPLASQRALASTDSSDSPWNSGANVNRQEQTLMVEDELQRLLATKSYLDLDAELEPSLHRLTVEACLHFNLPIARIWIVDLGQTISLGLSDEDSNGSTGIGIDARQFRRTESLGSHVIAQRSGILVVPDTSKDTRLGCYPCVTGSPHVRFFAGAPLLSPEGVKIGAFCVAGPDPRPIPTDTNDLRKLQQFAQKAMELLVQRRERIRQTSCLEKTTLTDSTPQHGDSHTCSTAGPDSSSSSTSVAADTVIASQQHENQRGDLSRHAAVTTNLGGHLFRAGHCIVAMKLYQESVQTAMLVEQRGSGGAPNERRDEMVHLLDLLSTPSLEMNANDKNKTEANGQEVIYAKVAAMFPGVVSNEMSNNGPLIPNCRNCNVSDGLPGLFGPTSKIRRRPMDQCHSAPLVFSESFKIFMDEGTPDTLQFVISREQSSKATLFNMGLIHYHWGNPDTAFQFFDLAASLSRELHPLAFDPIVMASLNNMAQIHLQYGRPNDAEELLQDALARGNAALAAMYAENDYSKKNISNNSMDVVRSRRLRRKLARTVVNMGHVHYYQCDFVKAEATCVDALKLLHSNMEDMEVAAIRFNTALLRHHQGDSAGALVQLDQFLEHAAAADMEFQLAEGLHLKGRIMVEMGNLYESMKPLNEALRLRQGCTGKAAVRAAHADTLTLVGKVLLDREEYDFALMALKASLYIHRSLYPNDDLSFEGAQTLMEIGRGLHMNEEMEESLTAYIEVIEVTRKYFGGRHPFVARLYSIVGNLLLEAGKIDKACGYFSDAMRIHTENRLSPSSIHVVQDPLCQAHLFNVRTGAGTA